MALTHLETVETAYLKILKALQSEVKQTWTLFKAAV